VALALVGLTGPVTVQANDHDTQDDFDESVEQLNTSAADQEERHNLPHSMDQLDTNEDKRTLEDVIERLEADS
jgi:hypothetical protein